MKKSIFIIIPLLFCCVSCSTETNHSVYHADCTIHFVNYDGKQLYETTVPYGGTAVYHGPTPSRDAEVFRTYVFKGWDRDLNNVTSSFIETFKVSSYGTGCDIETVYLYHLPSSAEEIILPDVYQGQTVLSLGRNRNANTYTDLLAGSTTAKRIKFPRYAEIIGNRAIYGYERGFSFESIELPEKCREVRDWAFRSNDTVKSLKLNDGLETIGEYAFSGLGGLTSLKFGKNLKSIGQHAFAYSFDDHASISIYIPKSVTSIGEYAFYDTYYERYGYGDYEEVPVHITFYCEAESKPSGWAQKWNWYDIYEYYNKPAPAFTTNWGVPFPY